MPVETPAEYLLRPAVETPQTTDNIEKPNQKPKEDWEVEKSAEEIALQSLVDRLHDKAEKEASRVIKVSRG